MHSRGRVNDTMHDTAADVWTEQEVALVRGSGRLLREDRHSRSDEC